MGKEIAKKRIMDWADRVNKNEDLICKMKADMVDLAIESGSYLLMIKEELPHGEFMPFCEENIRVKRTQARKYMNAAEADPDLVIEYKASESASEGLDGFMRMLKRSQEEEASEEGCEQSNYQSTGNLQEGQGLEDPEEPDTWTEDELIEDSNNSTIERTIYGLEDLEKLTANVLHAGMLLDSIIEHVEITPEEFAQSLSREITHDGKNPRGAAVVAEYTAKVQMFMDLIVNTRGLLDTKPNLKVV